MLSQIVEPRPILPCIESDVTHAVVWIGVVGIVPREGYSFARWDAAMDAVCKTFQAMSPRSNRASPRNDIARSNQQGNTDRPGQRRTTNHVPGSHRKTHQNTPFTRLPTFVGQPTACDAVNYQDLAEEIRATCRRIITTDDADLQQVLCEKSVHSFANKPDRRATSHPQLWSKCWSRKIVIKK